LTSPYTGLVGLNELNLESNRSACVWQSDRVSIYVRFSPDGRVTEITMFPVRRANETPVAMFRRWLRLQNHGSTQ
jgi:hypothetical protein